jgi:hypothetical protein
MNEKEIELPRIAVAMEKTRQLVQFEPCKVFVSLSESVEKITPEKIREMIRIAEQEVDIKLGSLEVKRR